jgi:hypothetical protein
VAKSPAAATAPSSKRTGDFWVTASSFVVLILVIGLVVAQMAPPEALPDTAKEHVPPVVEEWHCKMHDDKKAEN